MIAPAIKNGSNKHMEPNVTPRPNAPSDVPNEQPVEAVQSEELASPELTAQVDDLMATSAAETASAEVPQASEVITPSFSSAETPETPETVAPEDVVPEVATFPQPEAVQPEPAQSDAFPVMRPVEPQAVTAPVASEVASDAAPQAEPTAPIPPFVDPVAASASTPPAAKRSWAKPVVLILAIVVGLAAVSTAVYAEVIVPNRPENVLMKSFVNSVQESQVSYTGALDLDSNGTAIKVDLSGKQDNAKQASAVQLTTTMSGITLPIEARLVDKNAYVKVGDLTPVVTLLGAFGDPSTTKVMTAVSQQLSNKWVSIDSTLLKQAGVSCLTDSKFTLTQADVMLLEDQYKTNPFATIQSTADDTVNGQKVAKYQLSIDDDKAVTYGSNLSNLSLNKTLKACNKTASTTKASNSLRDHDKTPLTVWVDKGSKQIVQIASESTSQDAGKGVKGSGKISFTYGPVSISAPSDSTPVLEVIANLQKSLGIPASSGSGLDLSKLLNSNVSAKISTTTNR